VTLTRPRAEWLRLLEEADIPCGPINTYPEVFADPQVIARRMAVSVDHPVLGTLRALGTPLKMSETPLDPLRRAPLLGEHTLQVLREAGLSENEIEALVASGAAGLGDAGN
jgi:glutaryl-CoA transferase